MLPEKHKSLLWWANSSTQQTWWLKQEAGRSMAHVFKLSAPTPSDILHLARPHILNLPTQLYQLGTKNSNVESTGHIHLTLYNGDHCYGKQQDKGCVVEL